MKKLTHKSLVVLGLFATMFMFGNSATGTFKENEPNVTSMSFKKVKFGSKLSIKDGQGLVLYKESILKTGDYRKEFDLTTLPNGNYYFELDSEFKIMIIPFKVVSNQVEFKKEEKSTIFKPYVRVKDKMVFVSRVSLEESPIEYKIYYADNYDVVLSEKFDSKSSVKRIYDFSKAKKGNYLFVFKSNGRKFTKTVKI